MATTVYFHTSSGGTLADISRGTNTLNLRGSNVGWLPVALLTGRGPGVQNVLTSTVAGPTAGVEVGSNTTPIEWISLPINADTTISGTITLNLRAAENNMSANVAINAKIERLDNTGAIVSTIAQTARTTELTVTTETAENFTVTPTSTAMNKGDRFRVTVYGDDSTANMGSGFTFTFWFGGTSAGASGDSFITFNETFGFITTAPSGSVLYLTDTAGPAIGANIEKEMWTARGGGVTSIVVNTTAGWTAPIQWTDTGGGTAVEWYSKQVQAFTLGGLATLTFRVTRSAGGAINGGRAELAVVNNDGSGATVWAAACYNALVPPVASSSQFINLVETSYLLTLCGDDLSVADGKRLRLIVYIDDSADEPMVTGHTDTLFYAGTSGGASGDTFLTLTQTVTEFIDRTTFANPTIFQDPGLF